MKGHKQALIALGCLALAALLGYQLFRLSVVEVFGVDERAAQQLTEILPVQQGDSLLRTDEEQIRRAIEQDGGFICQNVDIDWPNTLKVTVTQRFPAGYIESGGQYAVIGQDGYVMRIAQEPPAQIPQILGLGTSSYTVGQTLLGAQDDRLEALAGILKALEAKDYFDQISSVNLLKTTWLTATTYDGVVCTLGMADNMQDKFFWIDTSMKRLRQMYTAEELYGCELDVSSGKSAVFSAHEPVEDPAEAQDSPAPEGTTAP